MPYIRVNCPKGALTLEQKAKLAPRIVHALIRQEIDPVTDIGTAATGFFFNELEVDNCFPGGVPLMQHPEKVFWTVECFVAESYFSQPRRDAMQKEIAEIFVDVLGDDGTLMQREDIRISPSYLMRLHVVIVNIPEGSWEQADGPSRPSRSASSSEQRGVQSDSKRHLNLELNSRRPVSPSSRPY